MAATPYETVAVALRDRILAGELPPGLPIPTIKQLASDHGVSPSTAQRAVALLAQWGLVSVTSGRRTLVRAYSTGAAGHGPQPTPAAALPDDAPPSRELLNLDVRHLGDVISTFSAELDPNNATELRRLLEGAIKRSGGRIADLIEYDLVVRKSDRSEAIRTFVAT